MFIWPPGMQQRTKNLISQILWTLWLDFEGTIEDSKDAPGELIKALRSHGQVTTPDMTIRLMLPHIAGGKYGTFIERETLDNRRTAALRLVSDLPDQSHLPDGAGKGVIDPIDAQLFGELSVPTSARGTTRDSTRDSTEKVLPPAPTEDHSTVQGASNDTTLEPERGPELARETRDDDDESPAIPAELVAGTPATNEFDARITELDTQADDLLQPSGPLGPRELLDSIHHLVGTLETQLAATVAATNPDPVTDQSALEEKSALLERSARLMRRVKDAEARLVERNKENEGLRRQMAVLQERYDRLDANMEAIKRSERAPGTHLRTAEKFIAERPHNRRGGETSKLVYTVG